MGIRPLKPVTPGSRFATRPDFADITTDKPEKNLTIALRKTGGRNNNGRITSRHRGVVTVVDIESLILNGISLKFLEKLLRLNMIPIDLPTLHSFIIMMVKNGIYLPHLV